MYDNKKKAVDKIMEEFEKLSNLVLSQVDILDHVLKHENEWISDSDLQKIENNEKKINKYEVKLDELVIRTIVLYNPMATDLRELIALYRMVIDMERIGDILLKIAYIIKKSRNQESVKEMASTIQNMLEVTKQMVQNALISFTNKDKEAAIWTIRKDESLNEMNRKLLSKAVKISDLPKESQQAFKTLDDVRSVISSLERIGDHATNIAETSVYFLSGEIIRHQELNDDE